MKLEHKVKYIYREWQANRMTKEIALASIGLAIDQHDMEEVEAARAKDVSQGSIEALVNPDAAKLTKSANP